MGFLERPLRIDLGDGEWIDVRRLTSDEFREMQKTAALAEPEFEGDDKETAGNFTLLREMRELIVAWSDEAPVTPENIARLPFDVNTKLAAGIGGGAESVPLPTGSPSTDSSTE